MTMPLTDGQGPYQPVTLPESYTAGRVIVLPWSTTLPAVFGPMSVRLPGVPPRAMPTTSRTGRRLQMRTMLPSGLPAPGSAPR